MKTPSNRVRKNCSTNRITSQVLPPDRKAICREARDAFIEFDNAASAAIALAQLNANHIEICIRERDGWQDFGSSVFKAGNRRLPLILADNFVSNFTSWQDAMSQMADQIDAGRLAGITEPEIKGEIEYFIRGVNQLLEMQDSQMDLRNKNNTYGLIVIVIEHLESAFDRARHAYHALASFVRTNNGETISQAV